MAPTSTYPAGAPTKTEFAGDDFSNNLFSDLAPLLTLFGEQVTKQFMSMSLGWADNILLAMGPLGIVTIVISAIRVSGLRKLKAIVGRAREGLAKAEAELLSSTSQNVCELWSGNEIVRVPGQPDDTRELVILRDEIGPDKGVDEDLRILSLEQAVRTGILEKHPHDDPDDPDDQGIAFYRRARIRRWNRSSRGPDPTRFHLSSQAPNITLNVAGCVTSGKELWFWAILGIALQITALVVPGLTVYWWKWQKDGSNVTAYGYPCFLSGSLAIIIGIIGCSHVIEGRTSEMEFRYCPEGIEEKSRIRHILRLQKSCTVGDQHFSSYAILNDRNDTLRTSRLLLGDEEYWSSLAAASTFITIAGFIVQFVGLRALHWSATIIQLGVTLVMTCCRALVRRGLATKPTCFPIEEQQEAAWLTLYALPCEQSPNGNQKAGQSANILSGWELFTGWDQNTPSLGVTRQRELETSMGYNLGNSFAASTMGYGSNQLTTENTTKPDEDIIRFCEQNIREPMISTDKYELTPAIKLHIQLQRTMGLSQSLKTWSERLFDAVSNIMSHILSTTDMNLKQEGALKSGHLTWTINSVHARLNSNTPSDLPAAQSLSTGLVVQDEKATADVEGCKKVSMIDYDELHSIMALWAYTLSYRTSNIKEYTHSQGFRISANLFGFDFSYGRSSSESFEGYPETQRYLRILGQVSENIDSAPHDEHSILDWIDLPLEFFKKQPGGFEKYRIDGLFGWPTFGMYMRERGLSRIDHIEGAGEIGVVDAYGLYQACAVELLSFFVAAIASQIDQIGGKTTEQERGLHDQSSDPPGARVEPQPSETHRRLERSRVLKKNTAVDALSECIVRAKLVESLAEANTIVIPALFKQGVLPQEVGSHYLLQQGNEGDNQPAGNTLP